MATITMASTSSRIMSAASSSSSTLNDIAISRTLPAPKSCPLPIPSKSLGKWPSFSRSDDKSLGVFGIKRRSLRVSAQITKLSDSKEGGTSGEKLASEPRARLVAQRTESLIVEETARPLAEYMSLPASQYSVLDAERIERVDDMTFRCYVYRFQFFTFEVCPVLLVRVEEQHNGCCIRLLSCTLEGSPVVVAQNKKFSASMVNNVSWSYSKESSTSRQLISDTTIEVVIEIPLPFRVIPVKLIESTGTQVLYQLLGAMLPRFLAQLAKDYRAWASGDSSRRPLGTGEI